jgi:hypothetical protein
MGSITGSDLCHGQGGKLEGYYWKGYVRFGREPIEYVQR